MLRDCETLNSKQPIFRQVMRLFMCWQVQRILFRLCTHRDETINKQYGHMPLSLVYYFVLAETLRGTSSRTTVVFHSKMFNALSIFFT